MRFHFSTFVLSTVTYQVSCLAPNPALNDQTRRTVLSTIAGSLVIAPALPTQAATGSPVASQDSVYIPGLGGGAPVRNLIIGEEDGVWNPPPLITNLAKSRLLAEELAPSNPPLIPFASDNELYYGTWLELLN
jgi:hypothetical protein